MRYVAIQLAITVLIVGVAVLNLSRGYVVSAAANAAAAACVLALAALTLRNVRRNR